VTTEIEPSRAHEAVGPRADDLPPAVTLGPARFINRELSWLEFNARVLALAGDTTVPLLERAKFLAIFSQNLDEFFQVRVAGVKEQVGAGVRTPTHDGLTPREQLAAIHRRVGELLDLQEALFRDHLRPSLAAAGIRIVGLADLDADDLAHVSAVYEQQIFPVLTPLAVDPAHPFPYISDLSLNLAVRVSSVADPAPRFARIKVPPNLSRFIALPDGARFLPIEELIAAHLPTLFAGMEIVSADAFRVTRDADIDLSDDEGEDLLAAVEEVLRRRRRSETVVRLEVDQRMSAEVVDLLRHELELEADEVHHVDGLLDLSGLWALVGLDRPDLRDPEWTPVTHPAFADLADVGTDEMFRRIRDRDVLVHHPYDSFATSYEAYLQAAAEDPNVLAIKQTLYRTSPGSSIIAALIGASAAGKQVVVLVELKARFDEQNNIAWARALEHAGVHVVYGIVGLKTHAKLSLVVRAEAGGIRRYCHVATGNYNPRTATIYEDVGLFSADPALGADLTDLFNVLTGYSRRQTYRKVLVAPVGLRDAIIERIRHEAQQADGHVVAKMNSLVDPAVIDALYEASAAGTRVDLVVRGICCLRPGVPGLSENIAVRSLVGRYLEHSRILRFGSEARGYEWYIGSADLMPRNLDMRVESLTPVTAPEAQARLAEIVELVLTDDELAWELDGEGVWQPPARVLGINTHERLHAQALLRARHDA
jgi:polyphosphate kinase